MQTDRLDSLRRNRPSASCEQADADIVETLRSDFTLVWESRYLSGEYGVPRIPVMSGKAIVGFRTDTSQRDAEAERIRRMIAANDESGIKTASRMYADLAAPIRKQQAFSEWFRAEAMKYGDNDRGSTT